MKKIPYFIVVLILLFIINNLAHSIIDIYQKQDVLTNAQKQLDREKTKNQKLKAELSYVQSQQFLEEEARNKLFLIKPGEQEILIPQTEEQKGSEAPKKQIPNWQQWLNLFF